MPEVDVPPLLSQRASLRSRIIDASVWSLVGYGLSLILRFGSNLLLTRLLVPEVFGIMAIANIVMIGLALLSDVGLRQSVVQNNRGHDPAFLNTAWVMQIIRGTLLCFAAVFVALLTVLADRLGIVPTGSVYSTPNLAYVIAALSITGGISGLSSTKLLEASRNLTLGRVTMIEIAAQFTGLICALVWLYFNRSIWSLVAGYISASLTTTLLSHAWMPGTANHWHWDKTAFREIAHFGKWIFISSILGFLALNGDRLLLGGMIDVTMLGVFVIAYNVYSMVQQVLSRMIASVTFPAFSELARERPHDLRASYYRIHAILASFTYFCAGILMVSGQQLIEVLYDPRYAQAGWMLEVLAAGLLPLPFHISIQFYMALGKPQIQSYISAIRLITLVVAMPLGFHYFGLPGALWGLVGSQFLFLPFLIAQNLKYELLSYRREMIFLPMIVLGFGVGKIIVIVANLLR